MMMTNHDAALLLFSIAAMIEAMAGNPYRVRAYRRAARTILRLREPAARYITGDGDLDHPGLGPSLRRKLGELFRTGDMAFYHDLSASLPPEMVDLMRVPGIGPKTALRFLVELDLRSPADVVRAAESGQIRRLYRFGPRREAALGRAARAVVAMDEYLPLAA